MGHHAGASAAGSQQSLRGSAVNSTTGGGEQKLEHGQVQQVLQQLLRELAHQRPEQELPQVEQLQQHAAIPASSASDDELQEGVEGIMLGWSGGHDQQQNWTSTWRLTSGDKNESATVSALVGWYECGSRRTWSCRGVRYYCSQGYRGGRQCSGVNFCR